MSGFDDLLAANQRYATSAPHGFDGIAHAGVAVVTCMDSRLQPLEMIGLFLGEAKILRTPGGHLTTDALNGCIVGVHLLEVTRIAVIAHTRCTMAGGSDAEIRQRILQATGTDIGDRVLGANPDQLGQIRADVEVLRTHELLAGRVTAGGFIYDVDNGELTQVC